MQNIVDVPLDEIDANPFRMTGEYPYVGHKLEALQRSFIEVGIWPGVVARRVGNRLQIAFGHHRVEAARRIKVEVMPLIVRELTDREMLQFMGRENLEDFNADFLCMLETWEAGGLFLRAAARKIPQAIDIARLLGWSRLDHGAASDRLNDVASACFSAHSLIAGGYLQREDLCELSVRAAREIVERAHTRMEQLEKMGAQGKRPASEIEHAKKQVGKGARTVARDYREGRAGLGMKDLRGQVDLETHRHAKASKRDSPLFAIFGQAVADSILKMLQTDTTAEKLAEIAEAVPNIRLEEDRRILGRIDHALEEHGDVTASWRKKLSPGHTVVPLRALK